MIRGRLLYIDNKKEGLLFRNLCFYRIDLGNGGIKKVAKFPESGFKLFASRIRLLQRLLRLEPRCVEELSKDVYVIGYCKKIWLLNTAQNTLISLIQSREGFSTPLNLCSNKNGIYWGEYGDNQKRDDVKVYHISKDCKIDVVYTFPKGSIRHIHNIVWDDKRDCFYVLTGDLERKSGIYWASEDWRIVKPIATGSQQLRAVVAFPHNDGLLYSTDSVSESNYIYILHDGDLKPLSPFPGSCIYGAEIKNYYVFASTVEPPEGRGLFNYFTRRLGAGINDRYTHLIAVKKSDLSVKEVFMTRKDILPMKLFQYGTLMFPKGGEGDNAVWYYTMACQGDGTTNQIIVAF